VVPTSAKLLVSKEIERVITSVLIHVFLEKKNSLRKRQKNRQLYSKIFLIFEEY